MLKIKKFFTSKSAVKAYAMLSLAFVLNFFFGSEAVAVLFMGDILAGDFRAHEDLKDEIDVLFQNERDMGLLSFVRFLPATLIAHAEKVEWREDEMPPESFNATASGVGADWDKATETSSLPVVTAQLEKVKVGDVLLLPSGEVTIVSAIDLEAQTLDLQKRGWGGTTGAVQGTSEIEVFIIGNAQVDGSNPMTPSEKTPTEVYNYVQGFEDSALVSGKTMLTRIARNSEMSRQMGIKLKRLLSQLNYAMIYGVREKTGNRATMQGLRDRSTLTYNVNGSLTVAKVYSIVTAMIEAGGSPAGLHGSPETIADVEQLFPSYVESSTSDWHAKLTVKKISLLGISIELHVDKHISSSELLLVDYNKVSYGPQSSDEMNGAFQAVEIKKNRKQWEKHIVGYYTMRQKQAGASVCRAYGIS